MSTIFGVAASPFVRKAILAHAYKGVEFELKMLPPGDNDPEFRQASPLGKIPGYKTDNGALFSDSSVIIAYLEKAHKAKPLYPENPESFARALWLEEYADTKLAEACNALYFQLVVGPKFFEHTTDEKRVVEIKEQLIPETLAYLNSQLTSGQWLVDNNLSVADIAVGTFLMNLEHAKFAIDASTYENVADFYQRFSAFDFVQAQFKMETGMLFN